MSCSIGCLQQRPLDVSRLGNSQHLGMIHWLSANLAQYDATSGIRRGVFEHAEEEGFREMEAAARCEEKTAAVEQSHRAQIDFLVPADRGGEGAPRLRECGRIEHDGVVPVACAFPFLQELERVRLTHVVIRQSIQREVLARAFERRCRRVQRGDMIRVARNVKRERTVITERVERAAARLYADERAILALIEKRSRLLSVPRRGQITHPLLSDFDRGGHFASQQFRLQRQSFLAAQRNVIACENTQWTHRLFDRRDDLIAKPLQTSAHQLHDNPAIILIANERRKRVAFAVNQAIRVGAGRYRRTTLYAGSYATQSPRRVDSRIRLRAE